MISRKVKLTNGDAKENLKLKKKTITILFAHIIIVNYNVIFTIYWENLYDMRI